MGEQLSPSRKRITMKLLLVLLLVAVAYAEPESKPEAEADPKALWYGYYGHPYTYGYGLGYRGWGGYYGGYYGHYPYSYGYRYWGRKKREAEGEAEPEAEADPALLYTHAYPYAYGGYYGAYPYTYGHLGYYGYHHPVTYTVAAAPKVEVTVPYRYYANSGGVVHAVAKREAEAAPEAEADPPRYWWQTHRHQLKILKLVIPSIRNCHHSNIVFKIISIIDIFCTIPIFGIFYFHLKFDQM